MKYLPIVLVALAVFGLGYIRLAPDDAALWHIDPQSVTRGPEPNQYLLRDTGGDAPSPAFGIAAPDLARAFDGYVLSRPRVTRLAGAPDQLWMTYIQRSKWIGFPDYISVRAIPRQGGGSALVIYSRSRYGGSDLGVNKARITRWLDGLHRTVGPLPDTAAK